MIDSSSLYKTPEGYAAMMAHYDAALEGWSPESRIVDTRHGKTHVLIDGPEGLPALFYFHGWGSNATDVRYQINLEALRQHYRVFAPDVIGQFGRSAPTRPPVNGPAYGEWIADMFDRLDIDQAIVSGISGGGFLSLKIASYAPQRVTKAFIISTAGVISLKRMPLKGVVAFLPGIIWPFQAGGHWIGRWMARRLLAPSPDPDQVRDMADFFLEIGRRCKSFGMPGTLTDEELKAITAPVFCLMGKHDISCHVDRVINRLRRLVLDFSFEIVPDAGHLLPAQRPDVVRQRMAEFLETGQAV
ncbi:MAG: alpha/beta hydrolase [Chloroflexi bacterium]|nr:alpha/beta hydrolase [Chloroflexota bacterium]